MRPKLRIKLNNMYRFSILFILLYFPNIGIGQSLSEIKTADSLQIVSIFPKLIQALKTNDLNYIKKVSASKIACDYCDKRFISIDNLMKSEFKNFTNSKILSAYDKRGYSVLQENFEIDGKKLYCAWIQTFLPEELEKGHEGGSIGFQFIKIGGKFKFYGLTSVP